MKIIEIEKAKGEFLEELEIINYLNRFDNIKYTFVDTNSVIVTPGRIEEMKKTYGLDETDPVLKSYREKIGGTITYHNRVAVNTEVETKKKEAFYKELWKSKRDIFSGREMDFIEYEIKYLESIGEKLQKKYFHKFMPFLTYLKNARDLGGIVSKKPSVLKTLKISQNNRNELKYVYDKLKPDFIKCTLSEFKKIFTGESISVDQKVKWHRSPASLNYFLTSIPLDRVSWKVVADCFVIDGKDLRGNKLKNAKIPSKKDKMIISNAVGYLTKKK